MGGWIINVNWSDNGIAFASSQDSTIAIIDFKNQKHDLIRCSHSPITKIFPLNDNEFYSISYDRNIRLYSKESEWKIKKVVTEEKKKENKGFEKIDVPNANIFRTGNVADALKIFNQAGLKKKESIKVDVEKMIILILLLLLDLLLMEIKLLVLIWLGLLNIGIFRILFKL